MTGIPGTGSTEPDFVRNQEDLNAAEGPYRGRMLKLATRTGDAVGSIVTTKITCTPR